MSERHMLGGCERPERWSGLRAVFAPKADEMANRAKELNEILQAIRDDGREVHSITLLFFSVGLYIAIMAGTTNHETLFLNAAIKLPIVNVDVSLTGASTLAPVVYIVLHIWTLRAVLSLSDRLGYFTQKAQLLSEHSEKHLRTLLPISPFIEWRASGPRSPKNRVLATSINSILYALMPISVLLLIQFTFLPYQSQWITSLHLLCVVIDVCLLWWLWPAINGPKQSRRANWAARVATALVFTTSVVFLLDQRPPFLARANPVTALIGDIPWPAWACPPRKAQAQRQLTAGYCFDHAWSRLQVLRPYVQDIKAFNDAVIVTANAISKAFEEAGRYYERLMLAEFADKGLPLRVGSECGVIYETGELIRDLQCLAAQARRRAAPPNGRDNLSQCDGASEQIREEALSFYDMNSFKASEAERCSIGVLVDGRFQALDSAEFISNALKQLHLLKMYAHGLVQLADPDAVPHITEDVVESVTAMNSLIERPLYAPAEGSQIRSIIVRSAQAGRFSVLERITQGADHVIKGTASILSRSAVRVFTVKLQDVGTDLVFAVPALRSGSEHDKWLHALEELRRRRDEYLRTYDTFPGPALEAMAEAHHALTQALLSGDQVYYKRSIKRFVSEADKLPAPDYVQKQR
jgi:hypothetical protein